MNEEPLMKFDSHIAGKNAIVRVYYDRIEWGKTGWMSTGAKAALGAATMGMSLLATGVRGKGEGETLFIRSITSVTDKKSGLTKNVVSVIASGNTIDFRCSQSEAVEFKRLLNQLVANGGQSPQPPAAQPPQYQQMPPRGYAPQYAPPPPPVAPPTPPPAPTPAAPSTDDIMAQLQKLGQLRDAGILSEEEFAAKKAELLSRL